MTVQPDVIVVGAGIVGLATAYFLGEAGVRVTVVEREAIGCAASGFAAGLLLATGDGTPPELGNLSRAGLRLHRDLAARLNEETGVDVQFRSLDLLEPVFSDEEAAALLAQRAAAMPSGPRRWLDGSTARALEPRLSAAAVGALYTPDQAQVDPYRVTLALAQAAERRGAIIRQGQVTGLLQNGRRVTGVQLANGALTGGQVVLTAGPWTGLMHTWVTVPIPVTPLRGQILRLRAERDPLHCCLLHGGNYLVLKADGLTWAGTTEELVGFRPRPTRTGRRAVMAAVLRLAPSLGEAEVVQQTACLRPLSTDGLPLMGPVPGWAGVYLATGHGRRGILLGPISGRSMAELILNRQPGVPLDSFAPGRFVAAERRTA